MGKTMAEPLAVVTHGPEETQRVGRILGELAQAGDVLLLKGGLGVGKTCLIQGVAWGLGVQEHARSPSFVLITQYQGRLTLYHADLYRLESVAEVLDVGLEEYFGGDGVVAIEWAERVPPDLPGNHLLVRMEWLGGQGRRLVFEPHGPRYETLVKELERRLGAAQEG